MRVIEIGKTGEQTTECPECYAKLGYFPADIHRKRLSSKYYTYIYCPICNKPIVLKKEDDPWEDLLD